MAAASCIRGDCCRLGVKSIGSDNPESHEDSTLHRHQARSQTMNLVEVRPLTDTGHHPLRLLDVAAAQQADPLSEPHLAQGRAAPDQRHLASREAHRRQPLQPPIDQGHAGDDDQIRLREDAAGRLGRAFTLARVQLENGYARRERAQRRDEMEPPDYRHLFASAAAPQSPIGVHLHPSIRRQRKQGLEGGETQAGFGTAVRRPLDQGEGARWETHSPASATAGGSAQCKPRLVSITSPATATASRSSDQPMGPCSPKAPRPSDG